MTYPLSVQLYSLREESQKDFIGVLKFLSKTGYAGVEPAIGLYGLKTKAFVDLVADLGMKISSSHFPYATPDNISEVVDTAKAFGVDTVGGGYGPDDFKDPDAILRTAEKTNIILDKLRGSGVQLFLHNHHWEFEKLPDGRFKYDLFLEHCAKVLLEIDTYWAANFGANDPAKAVARYADRAVLLHIKDGSLQRDVPQVAVGQGKMKIPAVVKAADPKVLRWLVVELDNCVGDMKQAIADSYKYMTSKGLGHGRDQS